MRPIGLLLFCCVLSATAADVPVPKEISVCWEDGLKPPYLMAGTDQRVSGIAVDMVDEILKRRGVKPRHVLRPWKRCLTEVEAGQVDLVPNASFREERAAYALYSSPLYETHLVLFYRLKRFPTPPAIASLDDMARFRLGGILGFNYDQYARRLAVDTTATNRISLLRMLEADRYDFAVEQLEIVQMMARRGELRLDEVGYVADPAAPTKAFHILVSKRHPQADRLKQIIDDGITTLQRDGTVRRIQARYLGN